MEYEIMGICGGAIDSLIPLSEDAHAENHYFVDRTINEYISGKNCFNRTGEVLFGAFKGSICLGICGLNIDPYTDDAGIGRVRHLYVLREYRGMGIGRALVGKVIDAADGAFEVLRLRSTPDAYGFYDKIGFRRNEGTHESHRIELGKAFV